MARQVKAERPARPAWTVLGTAEYRLGNWYEAREALERSEATPVKVIGPGPYILAMTLWQLGEADLARARLAAANKAAPKRPDLGPVRTEAEITLGLAAAPLQRSWSVLVDADQPTFDRWLGQMSAAGYEPMFLNTIAAGGRVRYSATAASGAPANRSWRVRTDKTVADFQVRFDSETAEKNWITGLAGHPLEDSAGYVSLWKWPAAGGACYHLVPGSALAVNFAKARDRGLRPVNISGFLYQKGYRLTTVYGPSDGTPWEWKEGLSADDLRAGPDVWRRQGSRPAIVYAYPKFPVTTPGSRFGVILVNDTAFAGWEFRAGLTAEEVRDTDERFRKDGYRPDQLVGYDDGAAARYVGVWVRERAPSAVPFRPMTGTPVRELAAFDRAMQTYMRERGITAGALAVMKDGKVVLSRGYGCADKDGKVRTAPDELFRLASVSKPITRPRSTS